jgi:hypothetical protein
MWEVGLPSSAVEFSSLCHSHKLSRNRLLGMHPHSRWSLSGLSNLFIYSPWKDFPSPTLQCSVHPTLFPACLCCSYCLLLSFSFFLRWWSVCPGSYADLAQGCLWEYCRTAKLTLSASSQAVWAWVTGGPGALLISPLNMKWRCSALAGGVEGSKFCLFSVILPARCVSSVSPRFHYRRHAFGFLPLAAILESLPQVFLLLIAGCVPLLLPSPCWLVYLQCPFLPLQCSGYPTLFAMCLFCCYCLLLSFSFFPRWGSVCPGGYADLAQSCLWKCCVPLSSPCPKPSGHRRLVARGPSWFLCLT